MKHSRGAYRNKNRHGRAVVPAIYKRGVENGARGAMKQVRATMVRDRVDGWPGQPPGHDAIRSLRSGAARSSRSTRRIFAMARSVASVPLLAARRSPGAKARRRRALVRLWPPVLKNRHGRAVVPAMTQSGGVCGCGFAALLLPVKVNAQAPGLHDPKGAGERMRSRGRHKRGEPFGDGLHCCARPRISRSSVMRTRPSSAQMSKRVSSEAP